jgi:hypothetical protein
MIHSLTQAPERRECNPGLSSELAISFFEFSQTLQLRWLLRTFSPRF